MADAWLDPDSPTWRAVKEHARGRIKTVRAELEAEGLSLPETENRRGRLAELKALMDLSEQKPEMPAGTTTYNE